MIAADADRLRDRVLAALADEGYMVDRADGRVLDVDGDPCPQGGDCLHPDHHVVAVVVAALGIPERPSGHVCVPECGPNKHIAFAGRREADGERMRADCPTCGATGILLTSEGLLWSHEPGSGRTRGKRSTCAHAGMAPSRQPRCNESMPAGMRMFGRCVKIRDHHDGDIPHADRYGNEWG